MSRKSFTMTETCTTMSWKRRFITHLKKNSKWAHILPRMSLQAEGQIHGIMKLQMKPAAKNADRDLAVHFIKDEQVVSIGHSSGLEYWACMFPLKEKSHEKSHRKRGGIHRRGNKVTSRMYSIRLCPLAQAMADITKP